jgi:hypothetical protein
MNVSSINADCKRQVRPGQTLPIIFTAINEKDPLFAQLFIDAPANIMDLVADRELEGRTSII